MQTALRMWMAGAVAMVAAGIAAAGDSDFQTWTSVSGATVEARFIEREDEGAVLLETRDGRRLRILADQLDAASRARLPAVPAEASPTPSAAPEPTGKVKPSRGKKGGEGSAPPLAPTVPPSGYGTSGAPLATEWPLGQPIADVVCPGDETAAFHLYLPRGLQAGRKYPLLFIVAASKPKLDMLGYLIDPAELNGFIVVVPNAGASENFDRALTVGRASLSNALARLPVDPRRVIGGGYSHGVRVAVLALGAIPKLEPAGLWLVGMGVGPEEIGRLPKHAAIAAIGAAGRISRWDLACNVHKFNQGRPARAWWHLSTSDWGPPEAVVDSLCWLNGMYLRQEKSFRPEAARERDAWAAMILDRIEPITETAPDRAAEWLELLSGFNAGGPVQTRVRALAQKLKGNAAADAWTRARPLMDQLVRKHFATSPKAYRHNNGTPAAKKDFEALIPKAEATSLVPILEAMSKPAAGGG